ncbi:MAG: hypothetical protein C0626_05820 [Arcobacter sp.]|nr:MAG: hypothetical protein C0626_05820 [Arcobacter sp.]
MTPFDLNKSINQLKLSTLFDDSSLFLYSYGRYALLDLLKKKKINTIYLPAFICKDILSPINTLGIEYKFYHVNEKLQPILENMKMDAIIMVNYFGFAQNIEPFLNYCQEYQSLLIEDNAHGFLSKDNEGRFLGTRGDFGIFSFRKTVFLPNGAGLLVNSSLGKNINFQNSQSQYTTEDNYYDNKLMIKKIINYTHPILGLIILKFRRLLRFIKTGHSLPTFDESSDIELPSNDKITPRLDTRVLQLDIQNEINRRKCMYNMIMFYAKNFNIQPIYGSLNKNTVPYAFAFIANEYEKNKF